MCCSREYIPLTLAYARTIHKFQGLSAGPVDNGKIPNMFDVLICDPDDKKYEGSCMGLLYTALSRATTLGDENGYGSAIYFTGSSLTEDRIKNMYFCTAKNEAFKRVETRKNWVDRLERNTIKTPKKLNKKQQEAIIWVTSKQFTYDQLYHRVQKYKSSQTTIRNKRKTRY